jgi:hypothetical protein
MPPFTPAHSPLHPPPPIAIVPARRRPACGRFDRHEEDSAVLPRRFTRSDEGSAFTDSERHLILAAETLRTGDTALKRPQGGDKSDEKMSMFWRVFGGTILSITALMFINAYQSLAHNIDQVRIDLGHMRDTSGEFIKKDEFNSRTNTIWTGIRDAQGVVPTVTVLTSKVTGLEGQLAAADGERKELVRELLQLRERIAKLEGSQEAKPVKPAAHAEPEKMPLSN